MTEPLSKAWQVGGDSIGERHGRRAEVESLHRHEATLASVHFNAGYGIRSSGVLPCAPPSPARAGAHNMSTQSAFLARVQPIPMSGGGPTDRQPQRAPGGS